MPARKTAGKEQDVEILNFGAVFTNFEGSQDVVQLKNATISAAAVFDTEEEAMEYAALLAQNIASGQVIEPRATNTMRRWPLPASRGSRLSYSLP